jgi:hypothetical protein
MEFKRRPKEDSPIYQRMLSEAETKEDYIRAFAYGDKVDAFNASGAVELAEMDYEGPDLDPGADRANCMKSIGRGSVPKRMQEALACMN